jgi:hypothetical protein
LAAWLAQGQGDSLSLAIALGVVVGALVVLEGWGLLIAALVERLTGQDPPWDQPGVRGAIGVTVFSSATGLLVLLGVPALVPLLLMAAAGLTGWVVSRQKLRVRREDLPLFGTRLGVLVLLGLWITIWALARPTWNACDDDVAYVPLGTEILHAGGLDQPFSQRRIGTLGAWLPLEYWGSLPLGPMGAVIGDSVICPLLAAAAILWSSRRWLGLAVGVSVAIVAVLAPPGRVNLGPNGVAVLMFVVAGIVAASSLATSGRGRVAAIVVTGALGSQLLGFRLHYALVALAPLLVLVLWDMRGRRLRLFGIAAVSAVMPLIGWILSSWTTMGTPLFPLLGRGTLNPNWHGYNDPAVATTIGSFGDRSLDLLGYHSTWAGLLVAMALSFAMLFIGGVNRQRFAVPLVMAVAATLTIVVYPDFLTTSTALQSWRLTRPLVLGSLLVLGVQLAVTIGTEPFRRWRGQATAGLTIATAALLMFWLGQVPWRHVGDQASDLTNGIRAARSFDTDPYRTVRSDYRALRDAVPRDAVVAYAVDEGALMDDIGKRRYNLDVVGANSPAPGMPFFAGAQKKLDYLRAQGVTDLVVVDPASSTCLYALSTWQYNAAGGGGRVYQLWAPYFLDWLHDVARLGRAPETRRFGRLWLIPTSVAGA